MFLSVAKPENGMSTFLKQVFLNDMTGFYIVFGNQNHRILDHSQHNTFSSTNIPSGVTVKRLPLRKLAHAIYRDFLSFKN